MSLLPTSSSTARGSLAVTCIFPPTPLHPLLCGGGRLSQRQQPPCSCPLQHLPLNTRRTKTPTTAAADVIGGRKRLRASTSSFVVALPPQHHHPILLRRCHRCCRHTPSLSHRPSLNTAIPGDVSGGSLRIAAKTRCNRPRPSFVPASPPSPPCGRTFAVPLGSSPRPLSSTSRRLGRQLSSRLS